MMWERMPGLFRLPEQAPNADICLFGAPFDGTSSGHAGSRYAPNAIRAASEFLEEYSPIQDRECSELSAIDVGDLALPLGNAESALSQIKEATEAILAKGQRPVMLGGEHLCTLPVIEVMAKHHPDLVVIQFDAHTDLREEYLGERLSHATVMKHIWPLLKDPQSIVTYGIRSGTKEEFALLKRCRVSGPIDGVIANRLTALRFHLEALKDRPAYITFDLDVFDPALFPGTGTPEPGGIWFDEFIQVVKLLSMMQIVGMDIVECCPPQDPSGNSSVFAAKIARELLLLMGGGPS